MSLIIFVLLGITEIGFAVLTAVKFNEKSVWLKNRAVFRAAETAVLAGMVLLFVKNMRWRFFVAVFLIAIRFIFAAIMWFVKRKRTTGYRKKSRLIANCIISLLLITVSLIPAFVFNGYGGLAVTGSLKVAEAEAILVDKSRIDSFENDGSYREVPLHFFYPEDKDGSFPLILFSHGAFGYYQSNFSTYTELASHGYVVVALDHPHHSFFAKDTDGKTVIADFKFIGDVMHINDESSNEEVFRLSQDWLSLRVDDENFVLDEIEVAKRSGSIGEAWHTDETETITKIIEKADIDRIGLMGHSLGGAASVAVGRERDDIDAVADLDGTMLGEILTVTDGKNVYNTEPYPVPILDFTKDCDFADREMYKKVNGYPYVNEYVMNYAKDGKTVVFNGVGHMDFTDLPLISPFIASQLGHGDVDSEEVMTNINGILLNWFDYYLKGEGTLEIRAQY